MPTHKLSTKVCEKCGLVARLPSTSMRCRAMERNAMGKTGYLCWGKLSVHAPAKVQPKEKPSPRQELERRVAFCRRQTATLQRRLVASVDKVAAVCRLLKKWEARTARLLDRAAMTDEQLAADRIERAKRSQQKPIRGIILRGKSHEEDI